MKFTHSLVVTGAGFYIAWICWMLPQIVKSDGIEHFDGPLPEHAASHDDSSDTARVVRVRKQTPPVAPAPEPTETEPQSTKGRPDPQPTRLTPSPPVVPTPSPQPAGPPLDQSSRQGTFGLAVKQLDVTFEHELSDAEFLDIVKSHDCDVVAFRVDDDLIVEAFLPDDFRFMKRVSGNSAGFTVDSWRAHHPVDRNYWIRWRDLQSPIGRRVRLSLQLSRVMPEDYFIYLVIGDRLSREINEVLLEESRRQQFEQDEVAYAQVVLRHDGQHFIPDVLKLERRRAQPIETGADQTPARSDGTSNMDFESPQTGDSWLPTGPLLESTPGDRHQAGRQT